MDKRTFRQARRSTRRELLSPAAPALVLCGLLAAVAALMLIRGDDRLAVLALACAAPVGALLLLWVHGRRLDRRLLAPLSRLAAAARRAAAGDLSAAVEPDGPVELREAMRSFNSVLATVAAARQRLQRAESGDALPNVGGTREFNELVAVEAERARRDRGSVGVVVIGVDGFRALNDALGRERGDEMLARTASGLRGVMRATDVLARLGGDEFALILPGADGDLAYAIAERARAAVAAAAPSERRMHGSAGVACYPEHARDGAALLPLAGGALRWAKNSGRNQARRFDPDHVAALTGEEERSELEALLARPEAITPVFQPLVALSTGRVLGYEALSRFSDSPGRGPAGWFDQANRCGLGPRLEALAVRTALSREGRPAGSFLSLNLGPSSLAAPEVQAELPDDLSEIVIEVTERELVADDDALVADLCALRARGARIAVDDAGAGYSGLQQMMRVRPDVIKLDRSLVEDVDSDQAKVALIDSFVRFARRTGASVCAEGIETLEELRTLADLDVTYGQGYALARPAPGWVGVSPNVAESLLRRSLRSQGDFSASVDMPGGDKGLERLTSRLAKVHTLGELESMAELIAEELAADGVCFSRWLPREDVVETVLEDGETTVGERFKLAGYPSTAHVLKTQEAVQVLVSDPGADIGEVALLGQLGYRSLLMVPVVCRDEVLGLVEAYSAAERPWTRGEINRARIISYQLGAVLSGLTSGNGAGDDLHALSA